MGWLESNRRGFLKGLAGAVGALVGSRVLPGVVEAIEEVDPDKLLWTPGKKAIFLPSAEPKVEPVYTRIIGADPGTIYRPGEIIKPSTRHIRVTHGDGAVEVFRRTWCMGTAYLMTSVSTSHADIPTQTRRYITSLLVTPAMTN